MWNRMIFLLLLLLAPGVTRAEAEFQYGKRPASGIFDPERSLSPDLTRLLTDELAKVRKRDLADVQVVILPSTGEVPPEHLAQRFSDAWGKGILHALVFDATNRTDGPWIIFGGEVARSDRNEIIPQMTKDILRRVHQEPDRESAIKAAAFESSDMLRFLLGKVQIQGESYRTARLQKELDAERSIRLRKLTIYGAAAAVIPVSILLIGLVLGIVRRRPKRFPPILWTRRLGAPYAGGNDAIIDLARRRSP